MDPTTAQTTVIRLTSAAISLHGMENMIEGIYLVEGAEAVAAS